MYPLNENKDSSITIFKLVIRVYEVKIALFSIVGFFLIKKTSSLSRIENNSGNEVTNPYFFAYHVVKYIIISEIFSIWVGISLTMVMIKNLKKN